MSLIIAFLFFGILVGKAKDAQSSGVPDTIVREEKGNVIITWKSDPLCRDGCGMTTGSDTGVKQHEFGNIRDWGGNLIVGAGDQTTTDDLGKSLRVVELRFPAPEQRMWRADDYMSSRAVEAQDRADEFMLRFYDAGKLSSQGDTYISMWGSGLGDLVTLLNNTQRTELAGYQFVRFTMATSGTYRRHIRYHSFTPDIDDYHCDLCTPDTVQTLGDASFLTYTSMGIHDELLYECHCNFFSCYTDDEIDMLLVRHRPL